MRSKKLGSNLEKWTLEELKTVVIKYQEENKEVEEDGHSYSEEIGDEETESEEDQEDQQEDTKVVEEDLESEFKIIGHDGDIEQKGY